MYNDTLQRIYLKFDDPQSFLNFLAVIEGVKPGFGVINVNVIKTELEELNLYYSKKHSGYITKNITLYHKWRKWFSFRTDDVLFLGYPNCCVQRFLSKEFPTDVFELYSLIKRVRRKEVTVLYFKHIIENSLYVPHRNCSIYCQKTWKLNKRYKSVLVKYKHLFPKLEKEIIADNIDSRIRRIKQAVHNAKWTKDIDSLAKKYNLNKGDLIELKNGLGNDNIKFGIKLINHIF